MRKNSIFFISIGLSVISVIELRVLGGFELIRYPELRLELETSQG